MTPQSTYNLFMFIGAVGTWMVLIGFVGAWLISARISRNSENEVAKLTQEVSVQRKNLEEKDKTISGLLEHQRSRQWTWIQEEQFRNILLGAPKCFIMVDSPIGDPEAFAFATQLQNLFRTAEWQVGGILGVTVFDPPVFGVVLQGSDDPSIAAVQQAFSAVDIPVEIKSGETSGLNEIKLLVGHKKYGVSQTPQEGPSNPSPWNTLEQSISGRSPVRLGR